jgi:hypothetical protein
MVWLYQALLFLYIYKHFVLRGGDLAKKLLQVHSKGRLGVVKKKKKSLAPV